jgi:hypothetical protein
LEVPNDSREVPRKQKTRRPKRSGITGAVSPKKMREEKKEMSILWNVREKKTRTENPSGSRRRIVAVLDSLGIERTTGLKVNRHAIYS